VGGRGHLQQVPARRRRVCRFLWFSQAALSGATSTKQTRQTEADASRWEAVIEAVCESGVARRDRRPWQAATAIAFARHRALR